MNCYHFDTSYITTTLIYGSELLQLGINFCFNFKLQYIIQKVSKIQAVSCFKCACMGKPIYKITEIMRNTDPKKLTSDSVCYDNKF